MVSPEGTPLGNLHFSLPKSHPLDPRLSEALQLPDVEVHQDLGLAAAEVLHLGHHLALEKVGSLPLFTRGKGRTLDHWMFILSG